MADTVLLIGVGTSFAFSAVFFHLYKEKLKMLQKLKEIPVFGPNQQLLNLLEATRQKRLQYVAVEGRVQADGEPLASPYVPRCFGVVQKIVEQQNFKYWNPQTNTWNSRPKSRKETNHTVPFSLVDSQSYIPDISVKVLNPQQASGSFLEPVHFKVHCPEEDMVNKVLQGLSGEKPGSKEESEMMLRVGTIVTGFGEVVLENSKVLSLQAPRDGREFILIASDYKSFLDRHEASVSMWKGFTAFTGITGTVLLTKALCSVIGGGDKKSK